jgi:glutathione synthase/RimK-type ligase-like ATP-grasp enzyme
MPTVGLLVGRERSFPEALIAEVARRDGAVTVRYAEVDAIRADRAPSYDVLVDRISHEIGCYQPFLKACALGGTRVVNNPFWRIADDKFFDVALAARLGVAVPKTVLLPSKSYGPDVTNESLRNLRYPIDWDGLAADLGFPMYLKPHWGGGWRDVQRVASMQELFTAYDRSGQLTMIAQEEIRWTQYVRCIVIGKEHVLPALWDPRQGHFERYTRAADTMPPLSPDLERRITTDATTLCRALGYDMNTVEFAVAGGVPYAIDFMNSAPDFDVSSLGDAHFRWVVERMAELVIELSRAPATSRPRWDALLDLGHRKLAELIAAYEAEHGQISDEEFARVREALRSD